MEDKNEPKRPDQTGGMEIERTHEFYEKGYPVLGTKEAGHDGALYHGPAKDEEVSSDKENNEETGNDSKPDKQGPTTARGMDN